MAEKDSIFRKESLERLSSPERLDQLMQVVNPLDWLPLVTLGSFIVLGIVWSIWGRIPITVTGKGILIQAHQVVTLESPISGQLKSVNVKPGQCIKKSHLLATIDPSDLRRQLRSQHSKLRQLQKQEQGSIVLQRQRIATEKAAITSARASLSNVCRILKLSHPHFIKKV